MSHSERMKSARVNSLIIAVAMLSMLSTGCGYGPTSKAVKIAPSVQTIYIPAFVNQTQKYKVEETVTAAVVREFLGRSRFKVTNDESVPHEAVLLGTITSATVTPLTYDSQTGRASTASVVVTIRVTLKENSGK